MKPAVKKVLHKLRIRTEGVPEAGSKEWYWDLRIKHAPMWMLPVMPVLYAWAITEHGTPSLVLAYTLGAWALASLALAVIVHALWRVEVNVAGNRNRPFTKKDHKTLHVAHGATAAAMFFLLLILVFTEPSGVTAAQAQAMDGAINGSIILLLTSSVLLSAITRIHDKGKQGYDELEKGV